MTKRNKNLCVKIARDVITQLRLKRYQATPGYYVRIDGDINYIDDDKSFKDIFKKRKNIVCNVCALGAAFVSLVNIKNKCSVDQMCNDNDLFNRLEEHFGADNINLMEAAFECEILRNLPIENITQDMLEAAVMWGEQYPDDSVRLRAIMLNIIRNNGDFKVPQKFLKKQAVGK